MAAITDAIVKPTPPRFAMDPARRRERLFFGGMAIALTLTVFAGFAPTYYLRGVFDSPNVLTPALYLHGVVFSAWMLLLVTQTSLIAARRVDLHRRLGVAGVVLALLMMALGAYVAISRIRSGLTAPIPGVEPLTFLVLPLAAIVVFPVLFGSALYFRRQSNIHKRLVLIATLELVTPAIARLPGMAALGPPAFFVATDLFLVAIALYDLVTLKRLHPATLWGGLFLVASQPLRLIIGGTEPWLAFAGWLTG